MVTAGGMLQRVRVKDISVVGRNTQGVRIIRLGEDDSLVSLARIPAEIVVEDAVVVVPPPPEATDGVTAADNLATPPEEPTAPTE